MHTINSLLNGALRLNQANRVPAYGQIFYLATKAERTGGLAYKNALGELLREQVDEKLGQGRHSADQVENLAHGILIATVVPVQTNGYQGSILKKARPSKASLVK